MTDIKDTLAALSEAATEGPWEFEVQTGHIFNRPTDLTRYVITDLQSSNDDNGYFIVALVNAYRTGQLVPVPSVERVAFQIWHQLGQIEENVRAGALTQDEVRTIATAVIAAMKEGRDG